MGESKVFNNNCIKFFLFLLEKNFRNFTLKGIEKSHECCVKKKTYKVSPFTLVEDSKSKAQIQPFF